MSPPLVSSDFALSTLERLKALDRRVGDLEQIELPAGALELRDEGAKQGNIDELDFVGGAVTATVSNGEATINIPTASPSGAWTFLEEQVVVGSPQDFITFTSITQSYRHLAFVLSVRTDDSTLGRRVYTEALFNLSTGPDYQWGDGLYSENEPADFDYDNLVDDDTIKHLQAPDVQDDDDIFAESLSFLPYYSSTDRWKTLFGISAFWVSRELLGDRMSFGRAAAYNDIITAAITSVRWRILIGWETAQSAGSFEVGSRIQMYGIT